MAKNRPNPFLENDITFLKAAKEFEEKGAEELKGKKQTAATNSTEAKSEKVNEPKDASKQEEIKPVKQAKVNAEPEHPVLSGLRDKPVMIYRNLHDLLKLLKVYKPDCDINKTANELIYEGLKENGLLKELEKLQASIKK